MGLALLRRSTVLRPFVAFGLLVACNGPITTELRVRDPWQIVPETPLGRVVLAPGARGDPAKCWNRDDDGFPHFYCSASRYELKEDGLLVVTGAAPTREEGRLRIVVPRYRHTFCHRPVRRCIASDGRFVLATPLANVVHVETHPDGSPAPYSF